MIEILSPVGNEEMLNAAVRSGADAVYLGLESFNARRNAGNFTPEALNSAVEYCHIRGVKVYLTLNTLVYDSEISAAIAAARTAAKAGIDGVIIADLGLASLLNKLYPTLPLHASTQLTVHTPEALYELKKLGFCRVVPSREMSKTELDTFCKTAKELQIEVEVFLHGALCMCMSGQCLMSATLGGRSGNRGLCAGTCRLPWKGAGSDYALSLRDLSLIDYVKELESMGVCSFKIEGRMKTPEYVAAVTATVRSAVDNPKPDPELIALCREVFSRSGFTDGYYKGELDRPMFGIRTDEDAKSTREVQNKIHNLYRTERQAVPVRFHFFARNCEPCSLTVTDGENAVTVRGDIPEPAQTRELTAEFLKGQLYRLGNTPYMPVGFSGGFPKNISLSAASLNALRRNAVEELSKIRAKKPQYKESKLTDTPDYLLRLEEPKILARFRSVSQIPENLKGIAAIILPAEELENYKGSLPVIADIPRGMSNQAFIKKCFELAKNRAKAALVGNLAAVNIAKSCKLPIIGGTGLNSLNIPTLQVLNNLGINAAVLSYETKAFSLKKGATPIPVGLEVYGRMPLMLTRNCPIKSGSCSDCRHEITDRKGVKFPVYCRGGYSEIYNSRPTYLADRLGELSAVDFFVLSFCDEPKSECEKIIRAYLCGAAPEGEYTRGLYSKGVL